MNITPHGAGNSRNFNADQDGFFREELINWDELPCTQIVAEKSVAYCPYVGGSKQQPKHIRTLRRWRSAHPRRGPAFLKIGGRYYYTVGALREFYERCRRGGCQ